ncbi:MAG: group II intron reverse transcriptase/maturase [Betaproteobacteria bacterium]|nr:MAG: group II intron reverse transcriptase/maturase [Betaproteobacteria bacterium]
MSKATRQKTKRCQHREVPTGETPGEALSRAEGGEAMLPQRDVTDAGQSLLARALETQNMHSAWKRVKRNKGAAGVDGMDIVQTGRHLASAWPQIKAELLTGNYRPSPVRRLSIPKPQGGTRELGIPTVTDRLIQQAVLQVLQPMIEPSLSESSYGFRPGRRATDAVQQAQRYVQSGKTVVVDIDLEKFFDRINHDLLMQRLKDRIKDEPVTRLIRRYLDAGVMDCGVLIERHEGTPQGGPLSPLLANLLLDAVDKTLERRGHSFVRYADDCNVYVGSHKAGARVMRTMSVLYGTLKLKINEQKSAVADALGRKFLGYELWRNGKGEIKRATAKQAIARFKTRIRQGTRRNAGRSMSQVIAGLRPYLLGWKAYFGLSQTPGVWRGLDEWLRHRMRALQLKQWRRGTTIWRELKALGAPDYVARTVAANSRRWWRNSAGSLNSVLTIAYFDRLGLPRLC